MEIREYRYAGPDGEGIPALPDGIGAAVGSEYCVHLMPGAEALAAAISATGKRRIPLLLLTPYFREEELKRSLALFRSIPPGFDIDVAVNDWGALFTLRTLLPALRLSLGRLLSGQKRCPRIAISAALSPEGRAWHGEGIFSSPLARDYLGKEFGISGYHVDPLEWAEAAFGKFRRGEDPEGVLLLHAHEPFAIVSVSDRCPWIGGKSSAAVGACPRPCRNGVVVLSEPSMGGEILQRGKARFFKKTSRSPAASPCNEPFRIVRYEEPP